MSNEYSQPERSVLTKVSDPDEIAAFVNEVFDLLDLGRNVTYSHQPAVKKELAVALMSNPSVVPWVKMPTQQ